MKFLKSQWFYTYKCFVFVKGVWYPGEVIIRKQIVVEVKIDSRYNAQKVYSNKNRSFGITTVKDSVPVIGVVHIINGNTIHRKELTTHEIQWVGGNSIINNSVRFRFNLLYYHWFMIKIGKHELWNEPSFGKLLSLIISVLALGLSIFNTFYKTR